MSSALPVTSYFSTTSPHPAYPPLSFCIQQSVIFLAKLATFFPSIKHRQHCPGNEVTTPTWCAKFSWPASQPHSWTLLLPTPLYMALSKQPASSSEAGFQQSTHHAAACAALLTHLRASLDCMFGAMRVQHSTAALGGITVLGHACQGPLGLTPRCQRSAPALRTGFYSSLLKQMLLFSFFHLQHC